MKLWNYLFIFTGMSLLLEIAGIHTTASQVLLALLGVTITSAGITAFDYTNVLWGAVFGSSGVLTNVVSLGGAIVIGLYLATKDRALLTVSLITGTYFMWASVIAGVFTYAINQGVAGWISTVIGLILIPLTIGFIVSCVDYFNGSD